ncbi:MAG: formate/nitrite transporter family protein [Acidimicrobiia bacterium]|nr:formate/nitrite transporter family protein [Acidimicrobiia bacterium]
MSAQLQETFDRTVEEGVYRINRGTQSLLATGTVGGLDVAMGVFALLLVKEATRSDISAALAFSIGFIALTLANSELFTENFLVPVAAVAARRARWPNVLRLWAGTASTNLVGGWVLMAFVMGGLPKLRPTAVELGTHYTHLGIGWTSFATAVLGGTVITLMTWMEHSSDSIGAKLVAAVVASFLLAAGSLDHVIVVSIEMFAALQAHAPFGYADWAGVAAWAALGNMIGGIGLVTVLRLVQVTGEDSNSRNRSGRRRRSRRGS